MRPHPNLAGVHRQKMATLEQALANPSDKAEAMAIVRGHIEGITLTPDGGGLEVMLHGHLAHILWSCEAGERIGERRLIRRRSVQSDPHRL